MIWLSHSDTMLFRTRVSFFAIAADLLIVIACVAFISLSQGFSFPSPSIRVEKWSDWRLAARGLPITAIRHSKQQSTTGTWLAAAGSTIQESDDETSKYSLEVSFEGKTLTTSIRRGETILSALERTFTADRLSMPSLPSDCRRGNCLTCVGRHSNNSSTTNLIRGEDGLTPYMSKEAKKRGYILTCSSYVSGDGVKIQIGANHDAWDELYRSRLEDEEPAKEAGRAAMAKVIRLNAERNVEEWAKETEETLRKTPE